jgi:lantibiotic biosynthesis protein
MTWRPLLDRERGEAARQIVERIARILMETDHVEARGNDGTPKRAALLIGFPGQAIAHAYLARAGFGSHHEARAADLLERGLAEVGELYNGGMLRGYGGTALAVEHLCGSSDEDDPNAAVDEAMAAELAARPHDIPYSYMHGLSGRAVYARERLHRPSGQALHATIIRRLVDSAVRGPDGVTWPVLTAVDDKPHDLRASWGCLGMIAILAACQHSPEAAEISREAMRWVWAQRSPDGGFPIQPGGKTTGITGWCIGDVGLGAVMLQAARALDDPTWMERWHEVLRRTTPRAPQPERGLHICHGAAGVAHMYARAWSMTEDASLRTAALAWFDCLLAHAEAEVPEMWTGLLDGLAGVALVLLAQLSEVDPSWDRIFLLS